MKQFLLILLILSINLTAVFAQTKTTPKTKITSGQITKTPVVVKTPTPLPAPASEVKKVEVAIETPTVQLDKFEVEIFDELNQFRRDPHKYAKHVEEYLKSFDGKYFRNSNGAMLESIEGKAPVEEIIGILKNTDSLPEFKLADGLAKAAQNHAEDMVKNNMTGHKGSNGSLPDQRARLYGLALSTVNENIAYGNTTARDVVLTMLIDDGYKSRNHRKNLLNPQLRVVGLATGDIKQAGMTCILMLATSYNSK